MSIIYDALKKVQKNIGKENPAQPETPPPAVKAKAKINPLLIYVFVVCLGLALGNFAYKLFSQPKNMAPAKNEPVATRSKTPAPASAPVTLAPAVNPETSVTPPAPKPEPTLVLNGVFFEQGEGYALINNKIVRLGDEVSSAKVKEITINGVELEFEGKTIKLRSPSN